MNKNFDFDLDSYDGDYNFHNTEMPVPLGYNYIMEERLSVLTDEQRAYAEWIVKKYTGWCSFADMCDNYPTLNPDIRGRGKASKLHRLRMQHLREFYAMVAGRPAFGHSMEPCWEGE